ncbi:MAG: GNAT family N-acetyltransferase [Bacteroidetes bacterium]|nr:GNAT family N-acetyltransferase [Bacteroidota bacterium]
MSLTLRTATPNDAALIVDFVKKLADYEKEPDAAVLTEADVLRDGFGDRPFFGCVLAEWNGNPAGFALYFFNYSTWQGKPGLYLEDLFVLPEFRKLGIGKALLKEMARVAASNGCGRLVWQVLDWNTPSIRFYESLGARWMKEWLTYRLEGDALIRLSTEP